MPNLLPATWKETLGRIYQKTNQFLEKCLHSRNSDAAPEHITEDQLPAFMPFGGPPLDLSESENELILAVEVPGLEQGDLTVELDNGQLMIRGNKKVTRKRELKGGSYLAECRYGSFARGVRLPYKIIESEIKANLKNGVLTIRMPKQDPSPKLQHRVPIK